MLVLGIDTSTPAVSVALVDVEGGLLAESVVVDARRHGELLAEGIRRVLLEAGADRRDVGAIAVGLGPGPFTGLRVGVVTAATLSDALGIPAYGTCSLDGLGEGERVAMTDARRREVYWARYDLVGTRTDGPHVSRPDDLVDELRGIRVVGTGAQLYAEVLAGLDVRSEPLYPSAAALVGIVVPRIGSTADPLVPLYLRRPDAEQPGPPKRVTV
ncbi:MAG: tRNA threonylcarbamoyladenosine biosynthesis protein TsaB [Actinomycetota bacterium]|jgi:tRNA threonylcarbamoyl adenosine modification protein YeaZ|nr:tRNA threonylcarbamoyladenosine biosynthesis protein TsaB [Actinomycetota bacterium]